MLDNLLGADLPVAVRFAVAFVVVALVIVGLATGSRFLSKPRANEYLKPPPAPVQIAHMVERIESSGGVAAAAICLLIASAISFFVFLNSSTVLQEISALLMWSGNGIFWGVIMITAALGRKRTYVVYRDVAPAERQEPRFEKP
jgi:hypothetical protein